MLSDKVFKGFNVTWLELWLESITMMKKKAPAPDEFVNRRFNSWLFRDRRIAPSSVGKDFFVIASYGVNGAAGKLPDWMWNETHELPAFFLGQLVFLPIAYFPSGSRMCAIGINFQQEPQVFDREVKEVGAYLVFSFNAEVRKNSLKGFPDDFFIARLSPLAMFA